VPLHFLADLTRDDLTELGGSRSILLLPVAATEPHGPHLPLGTDTIIAEGHLAALADAMDDGGPNVVCLPIEAIGASAEHVGFSGVLSQEPDVLANRWYELLAAGAAMGFRRAVIISSHGGNSPSVDIAVGWARTRLDMLAVSTAWLRFGQPDDLFPPAELAHGIHGGAIETSLMQHYAPELVHDDEIRDFASDLPSMEEGTTHLSGFGKHRFGWMSRDLHPEGVVGDATLASAEKGAASAAHAIKGMTALLDDIAGFDLNRLRDPGEGRF
jgi:creatinine amidohydrolase